MSTLLRAGVGGLVVIETLLSAAAVLTAREWAWELDLDIPSGLSSPFLRMIEPLTPTGSIVSCNLKFFFEELWPILRINFIYLFFFLTHNRMKFVNFREMLGFPILPSNSQSPRHTNGIRGNNKVAE